ncbi:hypothetical protein B0J12DRAFT_689591 [Macrophomina phaseolina]|nr:hypothetical protein B0J12DRAFT_689591 [Macrophomina phaseolina]
MTSIIKNVTLLGVSGNLGLHVLEEFRNSAFNLSIIIRKDSKFTPPADVKTAPSDFSFESLKSNFHGQDAVISLLGPAGVDIQQTVAEAAIAAGVKRFIPSEFSADTASPGALELIPFLHPKRQLVEFLRSKEDTGTTWTAIPTSAFLDWGLETGFMGFNLKAREVTLWDDGEALFSTNTRATIGKALVAILSDKNLDKTKNQYVYLSSYITSQKEILAICEKVTGTKWKIVERVDASERMKKVHEELKNNDFSSALDLLRVATYGKEKELCKWENTWNKELCLADQSLEDDIAALF